MPKTTDRKNAKSAGLGLFTLLCCFLVLTSIASGQLMPWDTEGTVSAQVVMRITKRENWPYLKFSPPLDFKRSSGDLGGTFDIKNVRYVALVADADLDFKLLDKVIKSGHFITITGKFVPRTTIHQPGLLF